MLVFKILLGWFALSGIAGFFIYCCSRVSEDERQAEAPATTAADEDLEPSAEPN